MRISMKTLVMGFIVSAILFSSPISSAQNPNNRRDRVGSENQDRSSHQTRANEMMDSMKVWKVTELLEVDEKLAEKLYPRIREQGKVRRESEKVLHESIRKLENLLEQSPIDEQLLTDGMEQYMDQRKQRAIADQDALNRILEILTVKQRAQYLVVEDEFPRMVRKFLKQRGKGMDSEQGRSSRRDRPGKTP